MKGNRRSFIKKAALGSASISSFAGVGLIVDGCNDPTPEKEIVTNVTIPEWEISFDEVTGKLLLSNGNVSAEGLLSFVSGDKKWRVVSSRDGIKERLALADQDDNVQGYIVFRKNAGSLQLLCYHRTAQSYKGTLSFEGRITFLPGGFACRTRAGNTERVLSLACGGTESLLNDSLFAPECDTIFMMDSPMLNIGKEENDSFTFKMVGSIDKASESVFSFILENDYFRKRYVPYYHPIDRKRAPKAPTGWMSWNTYFDKATADDNLAEARTGQKYLQPFGCEFWHIESWQGNSDHLPVSNFHNMNLEVSERKFPGGMKKLADDIKALGFRPGLWTAPFGTGNEEFYNRHKSWFLHDKVGNPVSCWNGIYTLDPTVDDALDHLKKIHNIASREWGYEYFKIDGMSGRSHGYCAHLYERPEIRALFHDPACPDPFERCVKAFREGIGDDRVMLACQGHTSGPDVLYADASRIGADIVHPDEPVKWTGVLGQGSCFMNQAFTHNIVTYSDPDTLLVRDLPLNEARISATIVALPGQLTFFGDKLTSLPADRMKILQQTLPPADVRPMSLYPYFSMLPVWNLFVGNKLTGDYNVVALFNWNDEPSAISFDAAELGIDPEAEYVLFEFWSQKYAGTMKGSYETIIPGRNVKLFAVHRRQDRPQWLSSDRHVAQTASELKEYAWQNADNSIDGVISLIGTFPLTMHIRVPEGFTFDKASCDGPACSAERSGEILSVRFGPPATGDYHFRISFKS